MKAECAFLDMNTKKMMSTIPSMAESANIRDGDGKGRVSEPTEGVPQKAVGANPIQGVRQEQTRSGAVSRGCRQCRRAVCVCDNTAAMGCVAASLEPPRSQKPM